jgi:hypothetical protein
MSLLKFERPLVRNLGEMATEIHHWNEHEAMAFDDPMGCGECTDLIAASLEKERERWEALMEKKYGLPFGTITDEIKKRTSPRWAYFNLHC